MQTGKKREGFKLKVGFAESKVIAINPDLKELEELGRNIEDLEEPIYLTEKDGVDQLRIDFYMRDVKTNYEYKRVFFIKNVPAQTKQKEGYETSDFVSKKQFINQTGDSFYAESEDLLPERFTHYTKKKDKTSKEVIVLGEKEFRQALVGEADLLYFVRRWLSELNIFSPENNLLLDTKALFREDLSELKEQINGGNEGNVLDLLEINTVINKETGESKDYQSVYKAVLFGYENRAIKSVDFSDENIEQWRSEKYDKTNNPTGRYLKSWEQIAVDYTDSEYGSKNYTVFGPLQDYDATLNFARNDDPVDKEAARY